MKKRTVAILVFLAFLAAAWFGIRVSPLGVQLTTGAGIAAKQLCSLVFVSRLEQDRALELYVNPLLREATAILWVDIDLVDQTVTARVPGISTQHAIHRPGYGCTLEVDSNLEWQSGPGAKPNSPDMVLDETYRDQIFNTDKLATAVDRAFLQAPSAPLTNTLAAVVLHDGRLVAERYADGITSDTRLPGWSMAKSISATLIGILVQQDKLDVFAPGAIAEWRGTEDPRANITVDHLLRMTSGLALTEDKSGTDPNSRMMFEEPDAAHFAAIQPLQREIGTHFEYMSGNTVLAMRRFQEIVGGDVRVTHDFMQENLFGPLNMQSAIFEPDQAGTFLGFSYVFASARDWARFGNLYLNRGIVGDRRLLPDDWIDYVTTHTPQSHPQGYGAGFWINSEGEQANSEVAAMSPKDMLSANGFQGQYTHIIPSLGLVIVRLGATGFTGDELDRFPPFALEVVSALKTQINDDVVRKSSSASHAREYSR